MNLAQNYCFSFNKSRISVNNISSFVGAGGAGGAGGNYGAGGGVELPFGGVESSGHGREKEFEALYGFTVVKTVAIRHG